MEKSAEEAKKTVLRFYPTLLKLLPICELVERFYSLQLLSDHRKSKLDSLTSLKEKIAYFLDDVLIPGLSVNYTGHFDEMITMMKESDDVLARFLVEKLSPTAVSSEVLSLGPEASSITSSVTPAAVDTESVPVEFSVDQKMKNAFAQLLIKFVTEFTRPPPCGPNLSQVKVLCINYCESHHHESCDFTTSVSSMDDLFAKLANPVYCNFLNLGLLEYLAENVDNKCLKTSIRNYDDTFCNVKIKDELNSMVGYKVKAVRSGFRSKRYEVMFMKLIRKGITYGQVKQIKVAISHRIIHISPNSLIIKWYRKGCVCLGWLIPSCLVDVAYHSACTNIAMFKQLGIKYLIIGNYKVQPPVLTNRDTAETPMELLCRYYRHVIQRLQPVKLSQYMFSEGLLNKKDYTVILNAPCDQIKNRMILEHVHHYSSSYLFTFINVLQKAGNHRYLYDILLNALESAGFYNLPDDYDIAHDDDDYDDDSQLDHLSHHPCPDQNDKGCLKMNLSVKNTVQTLLAEYKKLQEPTLQDIDICYLQLFDNLCKLMESCDPGVFIDRCASLMASYNYNIPLFSDELLKELSEYHNVPAMLRYLMCYCTWCDLSIALKLFEIYNHPDGVKLLQKFRHMIDFTKPITEYPVHNPDSLLVPSENSPHTIMVTKYEPVNCPLSLKHIEMIKSLIAEKCVITFISCQFLSTTNDFQEFYWLIPKSVVPLIADKVKKSNSDLYKSGIKALSFYPGDNLISGLSADSNVGKINQQELDEMKLKYNILLQENDSLKSQLDTMHKQSKESRKIIEKHRELKADDAAIQTDLSFKVSMLTSHFISQHDKTTVGKGPQSKIFRDAPPLIPALVSSKYHIKWTRLADLPAAILGASIAVQDRKIYVSGGTSHFESTRNQIFVYEIDNDRWGQLPTPDHYYAIPHIIGGKLTLIGGRLVATTKLTNKVSTFNHTKQSWVSYYPNLLSVRNRPGVVTHLEYVIVAGGIGDDAALDDIEILDWIENSQWIRVSIHLPKPIYDLQLTISDNYLFVVGYTTANNHHYKCLYELPIAHLQNSTNQQSTSISWVELTPTTHRYSSLVTGISPLIVLGGFGTTGVSADINMYERLTQKWKKIDSLSFARSSAAVAVINNNAIFVIGGYTKQGGFTDAMSSILTVVELGQVEET